MNRLTVGDLAAAAIPPLASITLADASTLLSMFSVALGAAYLARKWYREEKSTKKLAEFLKNNPDFSI